MAPIQHTTMRTAEMEVMREVNNSGDVLQRRAAKLTDD